MTDLSESLLTNTSSECSPNSVSLFVNIYSYGYAHIESLIDLHTGQTYFYRTFLTSIKGDLVARRNHLGQPSECRSDSVTA